MKIRRIIFPFYKQVKHQFLREQWWFRLIILLYICTIIVGIFYLVDHYSQVFWGWCYDNINPYSSNALSMDASEYLDKAFAECDTIRKANVGNMWGYVLFLTVVPHYLIQLTFFKAIIDFVVLGGKNNSEK